MKVIILAAGQGTRLRPLTNEKPKCMVPYNNKAIIDYILEAVSACGIQEISIVNGYKKNILKQHLKEYNIKYYTNKNFNQTNMVSSLFCAKEFMDDDLIISYSDIIYKKEVLNKLINSDGDINVVVDRCWKELWSLRMDNPLQDAETLKIQAGKIVEIGKKASRYDDIEGQYIGLIKVSKKYVDKFIDFYDSLSKTELYDNQNYENMFMTSFIQQIIDNLTEVKPIFIEGGWIEIDCVDDIEKYLENGVIF
jgi:L-glutamine-phosphate cytidylyltransferase